MSISKFDFIIVGAGAAGLNLALAMNADDFFRTKTILILDKEAKFKNDRTWSFWEQGQGKWDKLVTKTWNKGLVKAKGEDIFLDLKSYNYKMLRSEDFYAHAKETLQAPNFVWKTEEVQTIVQAKNSASVNTNKASYTADYVFDSRIPAKYTLEDPKYLNIAQHFKGWIIEAESPIFDDSVFTMMDYNLKDGESTSFTYILPLTKTKALVEFTYFSPNLVSESTYDHYLKKYITEHLGLDHYSILETEKGIIPMTNFPFEDFHQEHIIKIGTAGGWVKASSGYSFKNSERKSQTILAFLKSKKRFFKSPSTIKYQHYDKIFLEVLSKENDFGEELFYRLYKKNSIQTIFRFLDEQSSYGEDLKIILNLSSLPFIKAFARHAKSGFET